MSYDKASGESDLGVTTTVGTVRGSITENDPSDSSLRYAKVTSQRKESSVLSSSIPNLQRSALNNQKNKQAQKDAIRRWLNLARETADTMESYAKAEDFMELSLAGFKLRSILNDLWELRLQRENDWGDLLNMIQGALAKEEFERFTPEQCHYIYIIIADHLGSGATDIDDIDQSIKLLRKARLDPWKGISG